MQPTIPNLNKQNPYGANPIDNATFNPDQSSTNNSVDFYRNLIQTGQMSPDEAYGRIYNSYVSSLQNDPSSAHGYSIQQSSLDGIKNQLFQPMNVKNTMGRTGMLNSDGSISLQGAQVNNSVTTGAGTTMKSNFTPVVPYSSTTNGSAPAVTVASTPAYKLPVIPTQY